jgi:hypothetical protein
MAGTYAHISLVYSLCRDTNKLDSQEFLTNDLKRWLMTHEKFCELGAVSPDYPYMAIMNEECAGWANVMHYWKTTDFVRNAVDVLKAMDRSQVETQRCIVWLFGFAAHLITDLTVHPVVQRRVGPYADNKTDHRRCELNQDNFIFHEVGLGDIIKAEYVRDCGIRDCGAPEDRKKLYPPIAELWKHCLGMVSLSEARSQLPVAVPAQPPEPDKWHKAFVKIVNKVMEEGGSFPPLSRHILEKEALLYTDRSKIDGSYIENLEVPGGDRKHYREVFSEAQKNVLEGWNQLGKALSRQNAELFAIKNADLDTGLDQDGKLIYWG